MTMETALPNRRVLSRFITLLPLVAAVMFDAHIRHIISNTQSASLFVLIVAQLLLENTPLFVAHYLALSRDKHKALFWIAGFIAYPIVAFGLQHLLNLYREWSLFHLQSMVFAIVASTAYGLNHQFSKSESSARWPWVSKLFSLNSVFIILTVIWAVLSAGIFASVVDPMANQPLAAVIKSDQLMARPLDFISYFLQFSFLGLLVGTIFAINRYILIRHILTTQGLLGFVAACSIIIIAITPLFSQFVLWLPLSHTEFTLLPSGDRNIFSKYNYQFCFGILAISTPLILAFERQKQDKALLEIAQQKTQTELQLLQQQINPHFLFNTLNNLYALTLSQSDKAPDMVIQLSNLLRYTVYEGQKDRVQLSAEIDYMKNYLSLQQMRISSQCKIKTTFPDTPDNLEITPLLLIILLENAFKHGVEKCQNQCELDLTLALDKNQLTMTCSNTLPLTKDNEQTTGLGLNNLKRRLELVYPKRHQLTISRSEHVFTAQLIMDLSA